MILVVLWLFTSAYAIPLGTYPDGKACAIGAVATAAQFHHQAGPKPFLYRLACIPAVRLDGGASSRDGPAYSF
jgi:hypothetical protein